MSIHSFAQALSLSDCHYRNRATVSFGLKLFTALLRSMRHGWLCIPGRPFCVLLEQLAQLAAGINALAVNLSENWWHSGAVVSVNPVSESVLFSMQHRIGVLAPQLPTASSILQAALVASLPLLNGCGCCCLKVAAPVGTHFYAVLQRSCKL
jgi:hypothetical protein